MLTEIRVYTGITKKTQVIKGELNPVWNEVWEVKLKLAFLSKFYFLFYVPFKFEYMLSIMQLAVL